MRRGGGGAPPQQQSAVRQLQIAVRKIREALEEGKYAHALALCAQAVELDGAQEAYLLHALYAQAAERAGSGGGDGDGEGEGEEGEGAGEEGELLALAEREYRKCTELKPHEPSAWKPLVDLYEAGGEQDARSYAHAAAQLYRAVRDKARNVRRCAVLAAKTCIALGTVAAMGSGGSGGASGWVDVGAPLREFEQDFGGEDVGADDACRRELCMAQTVYCMVLARALSNELSRSHAAGGGVVGRGRSALRQKKHKGALTVSLRAVSGRGNEGGAKSDGSLPEDGVAATAAAAPLSKREQLAELLRAASEALLLTVQSLRHTQQQQQEPMHVRLADTAVAQDLGVTPWDTLEVLSGLCCRSLLELTNGVSGSGSAGENEGLDAAITRTRAIVGTFLTDDGCTALLEQCGNKVAALCAFPLVALSILFVLGPSELLPFREAVLHVETLLRVSPANCSGHVALVYGLFAKGEHGRAAAFAVHARQLIARVFSDSKPPLGTASESSAAHAATSALVTGLTSTASAYSGPTAVDFAFWTVHHMLRARLSHTQLWHSTACATQLLAQHQLPALQLPQPLRPPLATCAEFAPTATINACTGDQHAIESMCTYVDAFAAMTPLLVLGPIISARRAFSDTDLSTALHTCRAAVAATRSLPTMRPLHNGPSLLECLSALALASAQCRAGQPQDALRSTVKALRCESWVQSGDSAATTPSHNADADATVASHQSREEMYRTKFLDATCSLAQALDTLLAMHIVESVHAVLLDCGQFHAAASLALRVAHGHVGSIPTHEHKCWLLGLCGKTGRTLGAALSLVVARGITEGGNGTRPAVDQAQTQEQVQARPQTYRDASSFAHSYWQHLQARQGSAWFASISDADGGDPGDEMRRLATDLVGATVAFMGVLQSTTSSSVASANGSDPDSLRVADVCAALQRFSTKRAGSKSLWRRRGADRALAHAAEAATTAAQASADTEGRHARLHNIAAWAVHLLRTSLQRLQEASDNRETRQLSAQWASECHAWSGVCAWELRCLAMDPETRAATSLQEDAVVWAGGQQQQHLLRALHLDNASALAFTYMGLAQLADTLIDQTDRAPAGNEVHMADQCFRKALSFDPMDDIAGCTLSDLLDASDPVSVCVGGAAAVADSQDVERKEQKEEATTTPAIVQVWEEVATNHVYAVWAHARFGSWLLRNNNVSRATTLLQHASRQRPFDARLWSDLGECYMQLHKVTAAQRALATTLALNPDNSKAATYLGDLLLRAGDFAEALYWFEHALRLLPGNVIALQGATQVLLGQAHSDVSEGRVIRAAECLLRAVRHGNELVQTHADPARRPDILKLLGDVHTYAAHLPPDLLTALGAANAEGDTSVAAKLPSAAAAHRGSRMPQPFVSVSLTAPLAFVSAGMPFYEQVIELREHALHSEGGGGAKQAQQLQHQPEAADPKAQPLAVALYDAGANCYYQARALRDIVHGASVVASAEASTTVRSLQQRAIAFFQRAVETDPSHSASWNGLGLAHGSMLVGNGQDSNDESVQAQDGIDLEGIMRKQHCFVRAIQLDNNAAALTNLSLLYMQFRDTIRTRECVMALEGVSTSPMSWVLLGALLERKEDVAWDGSDKGALLSALHRQHEAFASYVASAEVAQPDDALAALGRLPWNLFGYGGLEEAVVQLCRFAQGHPHNAWAFNTLGWHLELAGRFDAAVQCYTNARELLAAAPTASVLHTLVHTNLQRCSTKAAFATADESALAVELPPSASSTSLPPPPGLSDVAASAAEPDTHTHTAAERLQQTMIKMTRCVAQAPATAVDWDAVRAHIADARELVVATASGHESASTGESGVQQRRLELLSHVLPQVPLCATVHKHALAELMQVLAFVKLGMLEMWSHIAQGQIAAAVQTSLETARVAFVQHRAWSTSEQARALPVNAAVHRALAGVFGFPLSLAARAVMRLAAQCSGECSGSTPLAGDVSIPPGEGDPVELCGKLMASILQNARVPPDSDVLTDFCRLGMAVVPVLRAGASENQPAAQRLLRQCRQLSRRAVRSSPSNAEAWQLLALVEQTQAVPSATGGGPVCSASAATLTEAALLQQGVSTTSGGGRGGTAAGAKPLSDNNGPSEGAVDTKSDAPVTLAAVGMVSVVVACLQELERVVVGRGSRSLVSTSSNNNNNAQANDDDVVRDALSSLVAADLRVSSAANKASSVIIHGASGNGKALSSQEIALAQATAVQSSVMQHGYRRDQEWKVRRALLMHPGSAQAWQAMGSVSSARMQRVFAEAVLDEGDDGAEGASTMSLLEDAERVRQHSDACFATLTHGTWQQSRVDWNERLSAARASVAETLSSGDTGGDDGTRFEPAIQVYKECLALCQQACSAASKGSDAQRLLVQSMCQVCRELAQLFVRASRPHSAIRMFLWSRELQDRDPGCGCSPEEVGVDMACAAWIQLEVLEDLGEAKHLLDAALQLHPLLVAAHVLLARMWTKRRKPKKAEDAAQRARNIMASLDRDRAAQYRSLASTFEEDLAVNASYYKRQLLRDGDDATAEAPEDVRADTNASAGAAEEKHSESSAFVGTVDRNASTLVGLRILLDQHWELQQPVVVADDP